ncbi:AEC family transporter [Kaistia geumhonensis]|uniref:Permease n=1 Tax=Kaistia geumhonensis TaxID=410839 RepID=A0ABU0M8Q7_9HYPH|nr:AEC family transporter [Kaistia geumhonensis]MCX5477433.1 AEC family transporter [Kaistia geumhonensis]MDQ0517360.1 putative permease [Kaistia geumhonensis]
MTARLAEIALIVLPIFALIGVGYVAGWTRHLGDRAADGLSEYVFGLAVPVLIFKTLSEAKLPEGGQPWGYWIAYFTGAFIVFGIGFVIALRIFRRGHLEAVMQGFASGQANTVFVGVPIILKAFGEEGAVPLFLLIAIHLPIMTTAATILAEGVESGVSRATLIRLAKALARNPILIGIYAGAIAKIAGIEATGVAGQAVDMIAASSVPCALVSMGLALRRYGFAGDIAASLTISLLKLVVHPLLVFGLTRVLPMPPVWAGVAVVFAAMPCGVNAYLLATHYRAGVASAASAVSLSTLISLFTITAWLYVLGVG